MLIAGGLSIVSTVQKIILWYQSKWSYNQGGVTIQLSLYFKTLSARTAWNGFTLKVVLKWMNPYIKSIYMCNIGVTAGWS